jgi:hypothetical protein
LIDLTGSALGSGIGRGGGGHRRISHGRGIMMPCACVETAKMVPTIVRTAIEIILFLMFELLSRVV